MKSQWFEYKEAAINLRRLGKSIKDIEKELGIPRSTLSGWFRAVKLTRNQRSKLMDNWRNALVKAREEAVIWHNNQKKFRIQLAKDQAEKILSKVDFTNKANLELALAMLYLGEGSKTNSTSMGNSNPIILRFFINSLNILYGIDPSDLKCDLHLRSDQNGDKLVKFWSRELDIPTSNFKYFKDKRTVKSKTYDTYMGVCVVRAGQIAILRRLNFISLGFCEKILETRTRSSVG